MQSVGVSIRHFLKVAILSLTSLDSSWVAGFWPSPRVPECGASRRWRCCTQCCPVGRGRCGGMRRVHAEFGTKRYYRKKDAGSLESSHILPKCLGRSSGKRSSSTTSATRRSRSFARPRAKRAAGVSEYLACVSKFWRKALSEVAETSASPEDVVARHAVQAR